MLLKEIFILCLFYVNLWSGQFTTTLGPFNFEKDAQRFGLLTEMKMQELRLEFAFCHNINDVGLSIDSKAFTWMRYGDSIESYYSYNPISSFLFFLVAYSDTQPKIINPSYLGLGVLPTLIILPQILSNWELKLNVFNPKNKILFGINTDIVKPSKGYFVFENHLGYRYLFELVALDFQVKKRWTDDNIRSIRLFGGISIIGY